jgi:hypothetical protein
VSNGGDLAVPIKLVSKEVEQNKRAGPQLAQELWQGCLIHLE